MNNMKEITYNIEFFSDWHCGSGLAAGADVDALVVKDKDGLPFVPGKTIKGLIKEAVDDINQFSKKEDKVSEENFKKAFGFFDKDSDKDNNEKGYLFFANAELPLNVRETIIKNNAQKFFFRSIASTAIGKDGIADEHSLRKMQVTVPCTLQGKIIADKINSDIENIIITAFDYIKRLGQNRNRGLGRCKFTHIQTKEVKNDDTEI